MPESPRPHTRRAATIAALAAPGALVLAALWLAGELRFWPALAGAAVAAAAVGLVARRQLAAVDALEARTGAIERERSLEARALAAANEAVLEAIPDPLILVDARRRIGRANAAARALFGDDISGRDLDNALRQPELLEAADECLAGRSDSEAIDLPWPGPPERNFAARFAALPEAQPSGGRTLLLVLHEVTALKQAERMRADFVANVSHELRTPLTALAGFVETLRGPARDDAEARARFLVIMHEQAQRMSRLVSDLLSLSRIEASEHSRPTASVALASVLRGVLDAVAATARGKGVRIDLDLPPDLPAVSGDADQLAQVFQNLVDNAIKYSKPQGRVQIVGRANEPPPPRLSASATGWVSVSVIDEGEGIAAAHLPRLTERFYRVDTARSRQLGGTGLGLAIVKHVLNRHRGALIIASEPGRGSTFAVWLPVRPSGPTDS